MLTNLICYSCIFAFQIYTMSAVEHILERMASENTYDELDNICGEAIEIIIAGHLSEEALAAIQPLQSRIPPLLLPFFPPPSLLRHASLNY